MALNNNREIYVKAAKSGFLVLFAVLLATVNVINFCTLSAVNRQYVFEYELPRDTLAAFRDPQIAGVYYTVPRQGPGKPVFMFMPAGGWYPEGKIVAVVRKFFAGNFENIYLIAAGEKGLKGFHTQDGASKNAFAERYAGELKQAFAQADVVLAVYGSDISAEKLKKTVSAFMENNKTLVIWVEDFETEKTAGTDVVRLLAAEKQLQPKVFNLLDYRGAGSLESRKKERNEGKLTLEQQAENLKLFARDYGKFLQPIGQPQKAGENAAADVLGHLRDKGRAVVLATDGKRREIFGDMFYEGPVNRAVKQSLNAALAEMPEAEIKLYLLTDYKMKIYDDEESFRQELKSGTGVMLESEGRIGVALPCFWQMYPEKKEFIKQLKIKSGLSPDYWIKGTKAYYFMTAEVASDEN